MKSDQLTESANDSEGRVVSNYHIKTLMLWACELKPSSWWTGDSSLVRICAELLHVLAVWLSETRCKHYFISKCNLVDKSFALETIARRLLLIDKYQLSLWFVSNYIGRSVRICPQSVSRLFDDVSTSAELADAVSAVVDWRIKTREIDRWRDFNSLENFIAENVSTFSEYDPPCLCLLTIELSKIDVRLSVYSAALTFLHFANRIVNLTGGMNEALMNAISVTANAYLDLSSIYTKRIRSLRHDMVTVGRNWQQITKRLSDCNKSGLVELLQQSAVGLLTTFLQVEEQDFGLVATIATTMFEALYAYKQGDYQQCLQLSTQNVDALLTDVYMTYLPTFPEFIQLLDDDIVSLSALTLIVDARCREGGSYDGFVTQLTLSLYLMTQCQLKLDHSLISLDETLEYIEVAQSRQDINWTLNHLILKLCERKLVERVMSPDSAID